jgi:hypothetical protein
VQSCFVEDDETSDAEVFSMRFLFLLHDDAQAAAGLTAADRRAIVNEHIAYGQMLRDRGAYVLGEALQDPEHGIVVRPGGTPPVTDGPFAETKDAIGGIYIVDCSGREAAIELAKQVPRSPGLAVEVIPVAEV